MKVIISFDIKYAKLSNNKSEKKKVSNVSFRTYFMQLNFWDPATLI